VSGKSTLYFTHPRSAPALIGARSRFRRFEGDDEEPTVEDLKAQLAAANTERDRFKTEADARQSERDAHKAKLDEIETSNLTEAEKVKASAKASEDRANAAEARAKETSLRLEIERASRKLGLVDEDAAYRLLDHGAIKFDADGKPTNVGTLIEQLAKDKPYLVGQGDQGAAGGSSPARPRGGEMSAIDIINADFGKSGRKSSFRI
jgi:hypothetical protein